MYVQMETSQMETSQMETSQMSKWQHHYRELQLLNAEIAHVVKNPLMVGNFLEAMNHNTMVLMDMYEKKREIEKNLDLERIVGHTLAKELD